MAGSSDTRHINRLQDCQSCVRGFESETMLNKHLLDHAQTSQKKVQIEERKVGGSTEISTQFVLMGFAEKTVYPEIKLIEKKQTGKEKQPHHENDSRCQSDIKHPLLTQFLTTAKQTVIEKDTGPLVSHIILPKETKQQKPTVSKFRMILPKETKQEKPTMSNSECRIFECILCKLIFPTEVELNDHMKTHPLSTQHKCIVCGKYFRSSQGLSQHLRMHNPSKSKQCGKGFFKLSQLEVHQKGHQKVHKKPHICTVCQKVFRDRSGLTRHLESHNSEKSFKCDVCDKTLRTARNLMLHSYKHSNNWPYMCEICGKGFALDSRLLSHMEVHKANKATVFTCRVCSCKFDDYKSHYKHTRQHTDGRNYKCSLCDRAYFEKYDLQRHMEIHTGVKSKHRCTECGKCCSGPKELQAHVCSHVRNHKCHLCKASYNTKQLLITHMQRNHFDELLQENESMNKESDEHDASTSQQSVLNKAEIMAKLITCYQCSSCNKVFPDKSSCEVHVESCNAKSISCDHCDKRFATHIELSTHMNDVHFELMSLARIPQGNCDSDGKDDRAHVLELRVGCNKSKRPKLCNICGREFKNVYLMANHLKEHPTGDWPPKCDVCGEIFKSEKKFRVHKFTHTNDWPFKCPQCEFGCMYEGRMTRHMSVHTGERPHKCAVCNMTFPQKADLSKHMTKHTGIKPFQCDHCGKAFRLKCNLTVHIQTHFKGNLETMTKKQSQPGKQKPTSGAKGAVPVGAQVTPSGSIFYPCAVCLDAFKTRSTLSRHMSKHTAEENALAAGQQDDQIM